ncbi:hypothetical protein MPH_04748 [Macrophomina phaseolina MS6]|uniref:Uncharacterized protein n=1 Tax=Macrophomina phaseolina (strain MS6) TaxID=1126212 RepID=K2RTK2_MACPH|nr:hypothetical protein MPH_04748 [Macrophomina phaseolina MS6]
MSQNSIQRSIWFWKADENRKIVKCSKNNEDIQNHPYLPHGPLQQCCKAFFAPLQLRHLCLGIFLPVQDDSIQVPEEDGLFPVCRLSPFDHDNVFSIELSSTPFMPHVFADSDFCGFVLVGADLVACRRMDADRVSESHPNSSSDDAQVFDMMLVPVESAFPARSGGESDRGLS